MKQFRTVFILLLSMFFVDTAKAQQREKFSAEEIKEDFKFLYKGLQDSHYDLYITTRKKIFDKEFNRINALINDSLTSLQINRLFQPFVALAKLGHCVTGYPFKSYNEFLAKGGKVFPFDVMIRNKRMYVSENYTKDTNIKKGDEIIAIYDANINHWLDGIYKYLSGENDEFKNTLIDLIGFPRLYWMIFDESKMFSIKIKKSNGQAVYVNSEGILASVYKVILNKKPSVFNVNRQFKFIDHVAYLHPGQFMNSVSDGNTSNHQSFVKGEFLQFIDSSFAQIYSKKVKDLIVDLRGNPGGDNSFSDPMIAYFANKPFSFTSAFYVKTSKFTKEFWKNEKDTFLSDIKHKILTHKDGEKFEVEIQKYLPKADSLSFKGNVYVLIDKYSYSNAATTAALIQDYGFGVLIGEQTADSPTTLAAVHEFNLPYTSISVTYPKAFMIRPNGDKSLRGVKPDFLVDDNIYTNEDEILNWTLKHIESK